MNKKTICLFTNWYPTKENPFQGLFFKEQAFALEDTYDYLVVHYLERLRKKPWARTKVTLVHQERNTREYNITTWLPLRMVFFDFLEEIKHKYFNKHWETGIGKVYSEKHEKCSRRLITDTFKQHIDSQIDVFYCVDAQREAFYIQSVAEQTGKPYMIGEHAPVPWPGHVMDNVNKAAIEKADLFLAISRDKIRQLMILNIQLPRTVYIGNLIQEDMLPLLQKNHSVKTLLIMAAHSFYKNYGMFIRVMDRLTQITKTPFRILIVGYASNKGYSKDTDQFEQLIKESAFADFTEMIPAVPHEKVGEVLNRADAFVMTSIQEGQPVSAMEAACCGLPIFSTRCGGVEDYVDEKTGRIFAINDVNGMAEGLKDYIEGRIAFDPQYIREKVVSLFGRDAFRKNFTEAVESVLMKGNE